MSITPEEYRGILQTAINRVEKVAETLKGEQRKGADIVLHDLRTSLSRMEIVDADPAE
jgi:hypothetical protein